MDTIKFDGPQIEVYRDAKVWMVEQKWTANVTKDSLGEGFEFDVNMVTKARAKTENDLTMDKKLQKKELAKHDETIKDIESSLDEVDEELRLKIQLLQKAIQ